MNSIRRWRSLRAGLLATAFLAVAALAAAVLALAVLVMAAPAMAAPATAAPATAAPVQKGEADRVTTLDSQKIRWHRLHFTAAKLFARGSATIELAETTPEDVAARFLEVPGHRRVEAAGPQLIQLELASAFGGRESTINLWIDPTDARALERLKLRSGGKAYQKTWRFTNDGIFSHRRAPLNSGEAKEAPEAWGKVEEEFRPHPAVTTPTMPGGCAAVTTPSALFYLASAATLQVGDNLQFCAVSGKTLSQVEVHAIDHRDVPVEYIRNTPSGPHPVRGEIETLRLVVSATPMDPREADGKFEFLGLEDDIELFLELEDRLPVEVRGRIPVLGGVAVKLATADLH